MANIKKTEQPSGGKDLQELELSRTAVGNVRGNNHRGNQFEIS